MTKEELKKSLDFVCEERERLQNENELYKTSLDESQEVVGDYIQRIEKAVEILKDTNVDMPSTLLIETIDNGINILNGRSDE